MNCRILLLVVLTTVLAGCGVSTDTSGTPNDQVIQEFPVETVDPGTKIATVDTAEDLVTWGSFMVRGRAVGERERGVSSFGPGKELLGREVVLAVDEVLWSHPDAIGRVVVGEELVVYTFPGYVRSEEMLTPAVDDGTLRMEVGQPYVVVLADDIGEGGQQVLTLLDTYPGQPDAIEFSDGTTLDFSNAARDLDESLRHATQTGAGPVPGESLVQRLERYTETP